MGSKRVWTVRGFDSLSTYSKSVSVQLSAVPSMVSLVVPSERKAVEKLLVDPVIRTMSPLIRATPDTANVENLVGYYINVKIPVNSYDAIRRNRSLIMNAVNQWAEKSRVTGARGFRANAVKTPIIEKNIEGSYSLKFNVLFSNVLFYTSNAFTAGAMNDAHATTDFESLAGLVKFAIGMPVTVTYKAV